MSRKLQIVLDNEAWNKVDSMMKDANENFENGSITFSALVSEMIISSKIDIKALQLKHANIRKSLRMLAAGKDIDLDQLTKVITELRNKTQKRKVTQPSPEEA